MTESLWYLIDMVVKADIPILLSQLYPFRPDSASCYEHFAFLRFLGQGSNLFVTMIVTVDPIGTTHIQQLICPAPQT